MRVSNYRFQTKLSPVSFLTDKKVNLAQRERKILKKIPGRKPLKEASHCPGFLP